MAIINMGRFGPQQENEYATGIRDFTSNYMEGRKIRANENINRDNIEQRERERKSREKLSGNTISSQLANQELRKREQDITNVKATHKRFSLWWNGMNEQEQAVAKTSDQYKEMSKFFKGFKNIAPGMLGPDGAIVASTNKDIYKNTLEEKTSKAKLSLAEGTASKEDIMLIKLLEQGKTDAMADALSDLEKEIDAGNVDKDDPKGPWDYLQEWWKTYHANEANSKALENYKPGQSTNPITDALAPAEARTNAPSKVSGEALLNRMDKSIDDEFNQELRNAGDFLGILGGR